MQKEDKAFNVHPADRVGNIQEYYFSRKLKEVAEMNANGKNVINLGIGSPDMRIARGLMSEDDYLLTEILFNPRTPHQIGRIQEELATLQDIIAKKDSDAMKNYLTKIRKNIE